MAKPRQKKPRDPNAWMKDWIIEVCVTDREAGITYEWKNLSQDQQQDFTRRMMASASRGMSDYYTAQGCR